MWISSLISGAMVLDFGDIFDSYTLSSLFEFLFPLQSVSLIPFPVFCFQRREKEYMLQKRP
jgi:hypothetical protein